MAANAKNSCKEDAMKTRLNHHPVLKFSQQLKISSDPKSEVVCQIYIYIYIYIYICIYIYRERVIERDRERQRDRQTDR